MEAYERSCMRVRVAKDSTNIHFHNQTRRAMILPNPTKRLDKFCDVGKWTCSRAFEAPDEITSFRQKQKLYIISNEKTRTHIHNTYVHIYTYFCRKFTVKCNHPDLYFNVNSVFSFLL